MTKPVCSYPNCHREAQDYWSPGCPDHTCGYCLRRVSFNQAVRLCLDCMIHLAGSSDEAIRKIQDDIDRDRRGP